MTSPEYPATSDNAFQIAEELRQNFSIMGEPYNNIVLSTDYPGFVDTYDPNILIDREALTLYWPGGRPADANQFETISLVNPQEAPSSSELAQEAMTIRKALLEASIGKTAIDRVPEDMRQGWEEVKLVHTAPKDSRMMHLWYPNYLSPKPVLATLKKVIRGVMAQETI